MSTQTTNLHLVKPADGETADIGVINGNMDTIDTAFGDLQESVSLLRKVKYDHVTASVTTPGKYIELDLLSSAYTVISAWDGASAGYRMIPFTAEGETWKAVVCDMNMALQGSGTFTVNFAYVER